MKAVVFTLGCKVNECESDSLIAGLENLDYQVTDKLEYADLYIVNTCAVTAEAERKSRQMISRIKKLNDKAKIIFLGCACQNNPQPFLEKSDNVLVSGSFSKNKILEMLEKSGEVSISEDTEFEELLPVKGKRTRAFIKVQDGCNNFCSYCIIPYLRGRSRSRNPVNVLNEINSVNAKEVVINGINLSSYNFNGVDLSGLMESLSGVDKRIRLGSLEVGVITRKLLESLKGLKNFAPHFHLSLQSGSDSVLKSMNRKYTTDKFLKKVELIREYFPQAGITTDVIVGFPTETEQDFINTLEFVERVGFSDIHPFIFSPRKGTVAYKMKDLDYQVKKKRLDILLEKKALLKLNFINANLNTKQTCLFEEYKQGYYQGYTENYIRVYSKNKVALGEISEVELAMPFNTGAICK